MIATGRAVLDLPRREPRALRELEVDQSEVRRVDADDLARAAPSLAREQRVEDDLRARRLDARQSSLDALRVERRSAPARTSSRPSCRSSSTSPSFCSTIGVITTLFEPSSRICARISCSAPLPMASIAITDATPNRMPSDVSAARSLLCPTASSGGAR